MDTRHLIDAIVAQTTILIAELATAAGIRAPLARVADQVFLDLARAVEAQGVSRKVVADMFGLALRTYQKKVNRLSESVTESDTTLWQAVLDFLQQQGSATRQQIFERSTSRPRGTQGQGLVLFRTTYSRDKRFRYRSRGDE